MAISTALVFVYIVMDPQTVYWSGSVFRICTGGQWLQALALALPIHLAAYRPLFMAACMLSMEQQIQTVIKCICSREGFRYLTVILERVRH